jgi:hypothetical protein
MYSTQNKNDKQKQNKQTKYEAKKKNSRNLEKKYLCCWMKLVGVVPNSSTNTRE